MFQVQPVRTRELQAQLAEALGCPLFDDTYAFYAGELSEDAAEITSLIGLCQFAFDPRKCVIRSVAAAPGCEKDEAVFIMVRTVMNWIYRAEIPYVTIEESAAPVDYIRSLGFRKIEGEWIIDLEKFYRSPCQYGHEE